MPKPNPKLSINTCILRLLTFFYLLYYTLIIFNESSNGYLYMLKKESPLFSTCFVLICLNQSLKYKTAPHSGKQSGKFCYWLPVLFNYRILCTKWQRSIYYFRCTGTHFAISSHRKSKRFSNIFLINF